MRRVTFAAAVPLALLALTTVAHSAAIHADPAPQIAPKQTWNRLAEKQTAKLATEIAQFADKHHRERTQGRRFNMCDLSNVLCEHTSCATCTAASASNFWIGYCTNTAQSEGGGFMGAYWGGGANDCASDKTVKDMKVECKVKSNGEDDDDCDDAKLQSKSDGYYRVGGIIMFYAN